MRSLGLIAILAIVSIGIVAIAQAGVPTRPIISLKPDMTIEVYPDGSIRILYNLSALIEGVKTNYTGSIMLGFHEEATNNTYRFDSSGAIDLKPITEAKTLKQGRVEAVSLLNIAGTRNSFTVKGNATIHIIAKGNITNTSTINLENITLNAVGGKAKLYVKAVIEGNMTRLSEKYIGNLTENITRELVGMNATWINVKKLEIKKVSENRYTIELDVELSLNDLVKQAVEKGVLDKVEAEEILGCVNNMYNNVKGYAKLAVAGVVEKQENNKAKVIGKYEISIYLKGEIESMITQSNKCSYKLAKLLSIIPLILTPAKPGAQPPPVMPGFMQPPQPLNLRPKLPYKASTTIRVNVEGTRITANVKSTTPRYTYPEDLGDPGKQARASLRELSSWLQNLNKQLSILALMGIPSPIPSKVKVKPAPQAENIVSITPTETTLAGLAEVKVIVATPVSTTTQTPPKQTTTTPLTTTITQTKTITQVKTITTTLTETQTITRNVTLTVTTTIKEVEPSLILTLAVTMIIVAIIVIVAVWILRRR